MARDQRGPETATGVEAVASAKAARGGEWLAVDLAHPLAQAAPVVEVGVREPAAVEGLLSGYRTAGKRHAPAQGPTVAVPGDDGNMMGVVGHRTDRVCRSHSERDETGCEGPGEQESDDQAMHVRPVSASAVAPLVPRRPL